MDQEKIGKFISKLRKEKGLTQEELAKKLNVTDRAVSHWENGRRLPDVFLFKSICEVLDVSINELICGEKIKNTNEKFDENIVKTIDIMKRKYKLLYMFLFVIGLFTIVLSYLFINSISRFTFIFIIIGIIILIFAFCKLFIKNHQIISSLFLLIILLCICYFIDYLCVLKINRIPIFMYDIKSKYGYVEYDSLFYKTYVINSGNDMEYYIVDSKNKYNDDNLPISIFNREKYSLDKAIDYSDKPFIGSGSISSFDLFLPLKCTYSTSIDESTKIDFNCDGYEINNDYLGYRKSFLYSSLVLFLTRNDIDKITYNTMGEYFIAYRDNFINNYPDYDKINVDNFNQLVERKLYNDFFFNKVFDRVFLGEYEGKSFIRTYKVSNIRKGSVRDSYYLTLSQCDGESSDVFVKNVDVNFEEGKYYEFSLIPIVNTNYIEDTIDSIFINTRISSVYKTNNECSSQIHDRINYYSIYK